MSDKRQLLPKRGANRRKAYIGSVQVVDAATGEILQNQNKYWSKPSKTQFITMYLNDENVYGLLAGLGNSGKVLGFILKDYNDKTGMFYFSSTTKELMIRDLKLSIGTIRSIVKDFANSKMLVHVGGSEYMVNPHLLYKGLQTSYEAMVDSFDSLLRISESRQLNKAIDAKTVKI